MRLLLSSTSTAGDADKTIRIPLRIHFVKAEDYSPINIPDGTNIDKTIEIVNLIWQQANIEFYVGSVELYESKDIEQYRNTISSKKSPQRNKVRALKNVCPKPKAYMQGIDISVVKNSFSPQHGGVAFNFSKLSSMVIWPLSSTRRSEQNPATLAHEIGHTLGLKHAGQDDSFLMRGAGNNIRRVGRYNEILLSKAEINTARRVAKKIGKY